MTITFEIAGQNTLKDVENLFKNYPHPSRSTRKGNVYEIKLAATEEIFYSYMLVFEPGAELENIQNNNFNVRYQNMKQSEDVILHFWKGNYHSIVNSSKTNWLILIVSERYCSKTLL